MSFSLGTKVKVREFSGQVVGYEGALDRYAIKTPGATYTCYVAGNLVSQDLELIDGAVYQDARGDVWLYLKATDRFRLLVSCGRPVSSGEWVVERGIEPWEMNGPVELLSRRRSS